MQSGKVEVERSLDSAGSLGAAFFPLVEEVLAAAAWSAADLDLIAVSIGPGSFTGLRVGLSVAKGLVVAAGCEVVGVPTLEALAQVAARREGADGKTICPVLDARKGEVYAARFGAQAGSATRLDEDRAVAPAVFAGEVDAREAVLIGDGVEAYRELWSAHLAGAELLPFAEYHPSGSVVAELGEAVYAAEGGQPVAVLAPRYCRAPEAQVNLRAAENGS